MHRKIKSALKMLKKKCKKRFYNLKNVEYLLENLKSGTIFFFWSSTFFQVVEIFLSKKSATNSPERCTFQKVLIKINNEIRRLELLFCNIRNAR